MVKINLIAPVVDIDPTRGYTFISSKDNPHDLEQSVIDTLDPLSYYYVTETTEGGGGTLPPIEIEVIKKYTHTQSTASTTWVIVHNLGGEFNVQAYSGINPLEPNTVSYDSANQVTLTFLTPQSGKAIVG